jgi:Fe-S cluster assembly protein SufD
MMDKIQTFSLLKEEPNWMLKTRLKAAKQIEELDFPLIERVKYQRWDLFQGEFDEEEYSENIPAFDDMEDNAFIAQVGTQTLMEQLPSELIEQGVILTDIFSAMQEHEELVQKYFMSKVVKPDESKMSAHHVAFMSSGIFLYVPKNVKVQLPIEAMFFQDANSTVPMNKHILIVADEHAEFTYLERLQMTGVGSAKSSANIMVEVVALNGAKVKFAAIDRLGEDMTAFITRRALVMNDASIDWAIGVMNDGNMVADYDSNLVGNGSHADMKVVAASSSRQVQGIDSRITNIGNHSVGHIFQHGVILDRSTLTFNGIGHILHGAKGADAQQESRVLMLSDKARGDANPILLIEENEVTAGHAASIGRIDPEDMYYLMSRGISEGEAKRLVIRGFLGNVLVNIPIRKVQNDFIEMLERKLGN